jgi:hypothetical protein
VTLELEELTIAPKVAVAVTTTTGVELTDAVREPSGADP